MSAPSLPTLLVSHWQLAWSLDLEAGAAAGLYLLAAHQVRGRWPVRRAASFLAGIATVVVALQSGVEAFDEQLLSVHMVQHMCLLLVAPLLLLGGQPVILVLRALRGRRRRSLARVLARAGPFATAPSCLAFFCAVVVLTHVPAFYDATLRHAVLHDGEHLLYLLAGLLMWWPVVDGDPVGARRLGAVSRLAYMIVAMAPMALVGAYLNRQPTLVYAPYGSPAHALGISAVVDQAQAGAIMWVGGDTIMVAVALWAALAALLAEERRQQARDARAAIAPAAGRELPG